ncbi:hypothetical protein [Streptomyces sp. SID13031]|uniref:hypothetical protein n=1 Tax=Streptomyces sp. SID13031 TaxID=2706046 RepID=UPI0019419AE8|nr:hypothetical protein [Streptomyces sp. SID13031]
MTTTPSRPMIRAVSPDELRFREIFDGNFRALLGYALRRTGSAEDAAAGLSSPGEPGTALCRGTALCGAQVAVIVLVASRIRITTPSRTR